MQASNEEKLREIFSVVLECTEGSDVTKIRRVTDKRWDSLAHASIIAAIESEFDVALDTGDMDRITSFAATTLLLEERGL